MNYLDPVVRMKVIGIGRWKLWKRKTRKKSKWKRKWMEINTNMKINMNIKRRMKVTRNRKTEKKRMRK